MKNGNSNDAKEKLFKLIPENGSPIGNKTLREQSKLEEKEFWDLRTKLINEGRIKKGKGKGGSVYRSEISPKKLKRTVGGLREADLYSHVERYVKEFWVKDNSEIDDFVIEKTAAQGSRKTGGKWTRPDLTLIAKTICTYLPVKTIDVITFEIKASLDEGISGVFETAAHSVFAHRSYLAIHIPEDNDRKTEEYSRIEEECERFGLGLIVFENPKDTDTYEIVVEAKRQDPNPFKSDEFIKTQLGKENQSTILKMQK